MHELSICRAIADTVNRAADGRPVRTVHLRIGRLRQIVPETLTYCWPLVNDGTSLSGSTLDIEHVPAQLRCRSCDRIQELTTPVLVCDKCAGQDVEITAGEEFLITSLDIVSHEVGDGVR